MLVRALSPTTGLPCFFFLPLQNKMSVCLSIYLSCIYQLIIYLSISIYLRTYLSTYYLSSSNHPSIYPSTHHLSTYLLSIIYQSSIYLPIYPSSICLSTYLLISILVFARVSLCVALVYRSLQRSGEGIQSHRTGVTEDCEPPCGCWELNPLQAIDSWC
jgi:hypothetical protein